MRKSVLVIAGFVALGAAIGCSSSSSGGAAGSAGYGASSGSGGAAGGGASAGSAGVAGTAGTGGAATDAGPDGQASCNSVVVATAQVTDTCAGTTTLPTMTGGGPVPDGIYDLTNSEQYLATCSSLATELESIQISGDTLNSVENSGGTVSRFTATIAYGGADGGSPEALAITFTCPAQPTPATLKYTFAGTTLQILHDSDTPPKMATFTLRQ